MVLEPQVAGAGGPGDQDRYPGWAGSLPRRWDFDMSAGLKARRFGVQRGLLLDD